MNDKINRKIAALEQKIRSLDAERISLMQQLNQLKVLKTHTIPSLVTQTSSNTEKTIDQSRNASLLLSDAARLI